VLEKDTVLLEGAEESQIVGPKHKEAPLGNNADHWPFKKAKEKQPARYREDIGVKLGSTTSVKDICVPSRTVWCTIQGE